MRKVVITNVLLMLSTMIYGQEDRAEVEFTVIRLDYQDFGVKFIYNFTQSVDMSSFEDNTTQYHGLDVNIVAAMDFGGTTMTGKLTGQIVYEATTVWNGIGEHIFPTREFEKSPGAIQLINSDFTYYDIANYFFTDDDYKLVEHAWEAVKRLKVSFSFAENLEYGVLAYLHYFSVGLNDPTTAEWIFVLYSLPDDITPYLRHHWISINNNLPTAYINSIAPHSFFGDSVWVGTNEGAFFSDSGGEDWRQVKFGDNHNVKVSTLETIPNPFVDCLCSVVGLGTEEPETGSTDSRGRIFRSMLEGFDWEFTKSPNLAVTALAFNRWNPYTMYAGLFHENTNEGGLYRLKKDSGWDKINYLTADVSYSSVINCITIDLKDTNKVYIGTERGIYYTDNNAQNWHYVMESFDIASIIISYFENQRVIYAATTGRSKSDGIYKSTDGGKSWEVIHWETNIKSLVQLENQFYPSANCCQFFYMAVYDQGVFESYNGCHSWRPINNGLTEKRVTDLAIHPSKHQQLYLGTVDGIFKYVPFYPEIDIAISDEDLAYWPPTPQDGELVEIYATVHNNSPYYLFNVEVSFVDNSDGMLTVIVPIDTLVIPYMLPNSEYTLRVEWYPKGQAGDNIIYVNVDPQNKIRELIENNNLASINIYLEEPPFKRKWQNITKNLPDTRINDIAGNPFIRGHIYTGTNGGAFSTSLNEYCWHQLKFETPADVKVTQISAEMHPYLDWTVPVLWLGTEEYNDIPEDRLGRVLLSEDGGEKWRNTNFPKIAVSAIGVSQINSLTAFAASFNPFYYKDDYYILSDSTWLGFDLTPGDTIANRINCFAFDGSDGQVTYIGAQNGLYIVNSNDVTSWHRTLENLNIVSIIVPQGFRCHMVYAATRGESYCDGFYKSVDGGKSFEKIGNFKNIVSVAATSDNIATETAAPHFYMAIYNKGVFESRNGGFSWEDITNNLVDKKITCLSVDRIDPEIAYLGTENGIYYYDDPPTEVNTGEDITENPKNFRLHQNYPNPFNNSTVIVYNIPDFVASTHTEIKIYNALGQEVKSFTYENLQPGLHQLLWNGTDNRGNIVNSGMYICQVSHEKLRNQIKLVLLK